MQENLTPLANPPPILADIHKLYQKAYEETAKDGARPRVDVKYQCPDILSLAEHLYEQILAYDVKASMDENNVKIANIFTGALAQTITARKKPASNCIIRLLHVIFCVNFSFPSIIVP